jgi:hypothetical protein
MTARIERLDTAERLALFECGALAKERSSTKCAVTAAFQAGSIGRLAGN